MFRTSTDHDNIFGKFIVTLIILLISLSSLAEKNYCHDPESQAEWEELVNKYSNDMGIQALHALRIGLCQKVDDDVLTVQEATNIFENMRQALIKRRTQEKRAAERMKEKEL
ncbi:MAG: hypothetical protein R6V55_01990 [Desulfovermiculus sp.]